MSGVKKAAYNCYDSVKYKYGFSEQSATVSEAT